MFYTTSMEEKKRAKDRDERPTPGKSSKRGAGGAAPPPEGKTLQKPGELRPQSSGTKKSSSTNSTVKGKKKQA